MSSPNVPASSPDKIDIASYNAGLEAAAQGFEKFFRGEDMLDVTYICGNIRSYLRQEPELTEEQYKEAALRLCAIWGEDPEKMVQAPSPRVGNTVMAVFCEEPRWAELVRYLKARRARKTREEQIVEVLKNV